MPKRESLAEELIRKGRAKMRKMERGRERASVREQKRKMAETQKRTERAEAKSSRERTTEALQQREYDALISAQKARETTTRKRREAGVYTVGERARQHAKPIAEGARTGSRILAREGGAFFRGLMAGGKSSRMRKKATRAQKPVARKARATR